MAATPSTRQSPIVSVLCNPIIADVGAAYLSPTLEQGLVEMTVPDKPNSRLQKYRLTARGRAALAEARRK